MEESVLRTIHSQPSYLLQGDQVALAVTRLGGHMAPVTFGRGPEAISPYYISPWQDEGHQSMPAEVLAPLRGDFFCMPFGANVEARDGEQHTVHGEVATKVWACESNTTKANGTARLVLSLETSIRPGRVTKEICLRPGHPAVYQCHTIEGFAGPTPLGHHATLAMPAEEGVFAISTCPFKLAMTNPGLFGDPAGGEYQSLALGKTFSDLKSVPSLWESPATVDCSRLPARRGFADLFAVVADVEALAGQPAWTAAVNTKENWCWFSLRDPTVLPMTAFWLENHGRHSFPWNGRNQCLGMEDVCGYFADGLVPSTEPNQLSEQGIPTAVTLDADRPTAVRSIQAAVPVPSDFGSVDRIEFADASVSLISDAGKAVAVPLDWTFVLGGALAR